MIKVTKNFPEYEAEVEVRSSEVPNQFTLNVRRSEDGSSTLFAKTIPGFLQSGLQLLYEREFTLTRKKGAYTLSYSADINPLPPKRVVRVVDIALHVLARTLRDVSQQREKGARPLVVEEIFAEATERLRQAIINIRPTIEEPSSLLGAPPGLLLKLFDAADRSMVTLLVEGEHITAGDRRQLATILEKKLEAAYGLVSDTQLSVDPRDDFQVLGSGERITFSLAAHDNPLPVPVHEMRATIIQILTPMVEEIKRGQPFSIAMRNLASPSWEVKPKSVTQRQPPPLAEAPFKEAVQALFCQRLSGALLNQLQHELFCALNPYPAAPKESGETPKNEERRITQHIASVLKNYPPIASEKDHYAQEIFTLANRTWQLGQNPGKT